MANMLCGTARPEGAPETFSGGGIADLKEGF
jgi:hypothetical protein